MLLKYYKIFKQSERESLENENRLCEKAGLFCGRNILLYFQLNFQFKYIYTLCLQKIYLEYYKMFQQAKTNLLKKKTYFSIFLYCVLGQKLNF